MPDKKLDANSLFDENGILRTAATPLMKKEAEAARKKVAQKKSKSKPKKKKAGKKKGVTTVKTKAKSKKKTCRETGCQRPVKSTGAKYCHNHHTRPERYSDPFC